MARDDDDDPGGGGISPEMLPIAQLVVRHMSIVPVLNTELAEFRARYAQMDPARPSDQELDDLATRVERITQILDELHDVDRATNDLAGDIADPAVKALAAADTERVDAFQPQLETIRLMVMQMREVRERRKG